MKQPQEEVMEEEEEEEEESIVEEDNVRFHQVQQQPQKKVIKNIPSREEIRTYTMGTLTAMLRMFGIGIPRDKAEMTVRLHNHFYGAAADDDTTITTTTKCARSSKLHFQDPEEDWIASSPFSEAKNNEIRSSSGDLRWRNNYCDGFLLKCHWLRKYSDLNGATHGISIIPSTKVWSALKCWKRRYLEKFQRGAVSSVCRQAIEIIDPTFFLNVTTILYRGNMYTREQYDEIARKQQLVESYQARGNNNIYQWIAGKCTNVVQIKNLVQSALYNVKLDEEIMNVQQHLLKALYGDCRNFEKLMDDNEDILTYSVHNLEIKGEDADQRCTYLDLPPGTIFSDYHNTNYNTDSSNEEKDIRPHVKLSFEELNGGFHQTCSIVDCRFCKLRMDEVIQFDLHYRNHEIRGPMDDDECKLEYQKKTDMANYYSYFAHPSFVQPTFQKVTHLTSCDNGCRVMTTQNGTIGVYHMADTQRMVKQIRELRCQVHSGIHQTLFNGISLLKIDQTMDFNCMEDDSDHNDVIENFELTGETTSNQDKISGLDETLLTVNETLDLTLNKTLDEDKPDVNTDDDVEMHVASDDSFPLDDTLDVDKENVNHDDDVEMDVDYEDYDDSFDTLHEIVDVTGNKETEDSMFPLADLFNINIGIGGRVVITEKDDCPGRPIHLIGFSHRWTELNPSNRTRTVLLLQDAIDWLVINVFPRIRHLLPPESLDNINDANHQDSHNEEVQRLWFIHNYIVVCALFNRIVKCLPWCFIEPLDLLKKSVMSEDILQVIYQIKLWLIVRACKNRWVAKEVVTDGDFENTVSIMLIPLLYILTSMCTGGAQAILVNASRMAAPGVGECHVLSYIYYLQPYTGDVYSPLIGNNNQKIYQNCVQKLNGGMGLSRWQYRLALKPVDTGDVGTIVRGKNVGTSRMIQNCLSPAGCPLGTMDHLDSHQFNSCINLDNCQKTENLDRIGMSSLVQPSNVSFSSEAVITIVMDDDASDL